MCEEHLLTKWKLTDNVHGTLADNVDGTLAMLMGRLKTANVHGVDWE